MSKGEKIKKSKTVTAAKKKHTPVQQESVFMKRFLNGVKLGLLLLFTTFCVFNVIASQLMPAIYFQFIKGDERAEVEFIKKARLLPEFQKIFPEIRQMFIKHEDEVYADQRARRSMITQLESVLEKNPHSRDVLYALARLYEQEGNLAQAETYLNQAKELDPLIDKK